jgi:N-acyl-L-homoserine lactone synthetase
MSTNSIVLNDREISPQKLPEPHDGRYFARTIGCEEQDLLEKCLRLRHAYFVSTRGWVSCNGTMQETDRYDPYCQHLAVFHNTHILAYLRLLPWNQDTGFMLEHDFSCLLSPHEQKTIIHTNSAELSRLVIAPDAGRCDDSHTLLPEQEVSNGLILPAGRATANGRASNGTPPAQFTPHVLEMLLKLLYHVSLEGGIECYYIVVEPRLLKILQRKFGVPFKPIGNVHTLPDGTQTVAAFTTLQDIEASIKHRWPQKYQWYRQLL